MGGAPEEYRALSGPQKAAVLMLALTEDQCTRLFGMMHEDEIKEVSAAMAQLGPVRSEVVERLCVEFADRLGQAGSLVGSFENTERLLMKTLPRDRVTQIMEEIRGPAGRTMWDKLGNVHEAVLANYLKNEYPQTVAVVLSKVRSDHSARVLSLLPDSFAMEVVMRMLRMESVQRDVLDGVERTLRAEFMSNLARSTRRDAHEMMAEIFNNLDRQAETRFIAALEERNREAAERIKALMFTFDDLQRLGGPAVQALLRTVEKDKLPLALKGASEKLRDLFFANLSDRAGKMLREEIEQLGPVKLREVDEAQASIVAVAKELAAQGQIDIAENKDEELVDQPMDPHAPNSGSHAAAGRARGRKPAILFDEDFDAPPFGAAPDGTIVDDPPEEPPPSPPAITAEDVAAARAEAFAEGLGRGLAQAAADRAEVTRQMLTAIADRLEGARHDAGRVAEEGAQAVARLLMGTLAGMLPTVCARHGEVEAAALVRAVLPALVREPRVTIRISPHVLGAVEEAIAGLDPDLHGRVMLVPTDAVPPGDARIAWADGVAIRDFAALWRAIAAALEPLDLLATQEETVPA